MPHYHQGRNLESRVIRYPRGDLMGDMMLTPNMASLEKVLDGTVSRHRVIADNIANVETPGFTRKEVSFEDQLNNVMSQSDDISTDKISDIRNITPSVSNDENAPRRENGNNVNIEHEAVELAKNSIQFETAAQLLTMEFRGVRSAIFEGRK
jgi:flagellar basal-body rod protein FlgB